MAASNGLESNPAHFAALELNIALISTLPIVSGREMGM
jgi:hypothetical protein